MQLMKKGSDEKRGGPASGGPPCMPYLYFIARLRTRRYVLLDLTDEASAWLVGLDALCRTHVDLIESQNSRPSMMPWLRAVFTGRSRRSDEREGRFRCAGRPIAISTRSLPYTFFAANRSVGHDEALAASPRTARVEHEERLLRARRSRATAATADAGAARRQQMKLPARVYHLPTLRRL